MIDRGDLAVEMKLESVAIFQRQILNSAIDRPKPDIVATELFHTMIENSFSIKVEVSDISNAVLDGASATMLSGGTAVGEYAAEAVTMKQRTCSVGHHYINCSVYRKNIKLENSIPKVLGDAITSICQSLPITKIVAVTISGYAARVISMKNFHQPLLALSNDVMAAKGCNLFLGTQGVFVDIPFSKININHVPECLFILWRRELIDLDDMLLVTAVAYPKSGNRMTLIQTHNVRDLAMIME